MFEFSLDKLKGLLAERGLKQIDVADALCISLSTFNNKMLGKNDFTLREIKELARFLNVEFLITGRE